MYNTDNSHMSYSDMVSSGTDGINFFCSGKCYMYPGGEWSISDVLTMLKNDPTIETILNLVLQLFPTCKDRRSGYYWWCKYLHRYQCTSEKQEAAFEFISYMAGKEAAKYIAAAGAIPAYIDDDITAVFEEATVYPEQLIS